MLEELDLGITQIKTLDVVSGCDSELSVKELSEHLGLSLPSASRTVEALLQRGWLERREDEHDRRVKRIRVTPGGRDVVARVNGVRLQGLERFAASLEPAQRAELSRRVACSHGPADRGRLSVMTFSMPAMNEDNRRWWTLGAMCFALFMIMLDNTVVNVALPSIQRDLDVSISGLEWTVNAYTLTFAVLLVTGGRLGDIFGRRRAFLIGVVIFGALEPVHRVLADRRRG